MDLGSEPRPLPDELYHGTASANLDAIFSDGLNPGRLRQVHLSIRPETVERVGQRHCKPVALRVEVKRMFDDSFELFCADNDVWLTDNVPSI